MLLKRREEQAHDIHLTSAAVRVGGGIDVDVVTTFETGRIHDGSAQGFGDFFGEIAHRYAFGGEGGSVACEQRATFGGGLVELRAAFRESQFVDLHFFALGMDFEAEAIGEQRAKHEAQVVFIGRGGRFGDDVKACFFEPGRTFDLERRDIVRPLNTDEEACALDGQRAGRSAEELAAIVVFVEAVARAGGRPDRCHFEGGRLGKAGYDGEKEKDCFAKAHK